jgi:hypothetical protein
VKYAWHVPVGNSGKLLVYPQVSVSPNPGETLYVALADDRDQVTDFDLPYPYPTNCAGNDHNNPNPAVCAQTSATNIRVGMTVVVPADGGGPTALRSVPHSPIKHMMPEGTLSNVIGGPYKCLENTIWWQLRTSDGFIGWSVEEYGGQIGIAPDTGSANTTSNNSSSSSSQSGGSGAASTVQCSGFELPSRVKVGDKGRILPTDITVKLNSQPMRPSLHPTSRIIGQLSTGALFAITGGPSCADGILWWQVNYNGTTGWIGEGQGTDYWFEPY